MKPYVVPPLTKSRAINGLTIFYCIGSSILSYYTWPWGFIFFGPTMGAVIHYAYSNRNDQGLATRPEQQIDSPDNNADPDPQEGSRNNNKPSVLLGIDNAITPTAPNQENPVIFQFNNYTLSINSPPGGASVAQIEGKNDNLTLGSKYNNP